MKERPILFSGEMVRALLDGRKTQTRRVVKPQPVEANGVWGGNYLKPPEGHGRDIDCPYGERGDRLWVREHHARVAANPFCVPHYFANGPMPTMDARHDAGLLRSYPSIHMPRWASRITLEIVSVRVERLQHISAKDAIAEGIRIEKGSGLIDGEDCYMMTSNSGYMRGPLGAIAAYRDLWESINGPGSWEKNPWVWVIEFKIAGAGDNGAERQLRPTSDGKAVVE